LYSVDVTNGQIERLGKDFDGNIVGYMTKADGSVYILGQWGTDVQIYSQHSSMDNSIKYRGWSGTYESIAVSGSSNRNCSIAFIYSSLRTPKEVYCIGNIDQLESAKAITNENGLWAQRTLPEAKNFYWESDEGNRTIEGILHYPPGQFEAKNLPLFVLIHGGPYDASLNHLQGNGYFWAPLAALSGWLVLEPNYRGSTEYGDQFLSEVRHQPIIRPGIDILSAVDRLIKNGIADPNRLAIGGYSYGGILTNWLITQTTRFNAAVSGAGSAEHVSTWSTMDWPVHINYLMGGFPWEVPHVYQNSGPMYYLDRVRTPTHLVTGTRDVRVPPAQSYMLERVLHSLGIPVQLLAFPNEGHSVINSNGSWYGKIKVREELKWLQQYGHQSWDKRKIEI
jgi:dipeptidyl aminopeptidase/acylaminoacyl peptidase